MHGHRPRAASFLVLRREVTNLPPPLPSSAPSRGRHGLTSHTMVHLRRGVSRVDRTRSSEGSRRRFGGRSPSSNQYRAPRSSYEHCYERRILSRVLLAPGVHSAQARGVHHKVSVSRISPRRAVRFTKTEVRSAVVRLDDPEDCSPFSSERASLPRSTCAPKNTDTLQIERACAFVTTSRCPA